MEDLQQDYGPTVGYEAGLTSAALQRQFAVSQQLLGCPLNKMLQSSGASLAADFGTRSMSKADLLLRMSSEGDQEGRPFRSRRARPGESDSLPGAI